MYGFGGRHLKIRDVCMDLEPCFKVHNLAVIQLKNTKLGQMTNFKVVFHMVVLLYKFDKIGNSTQSLLNLKVANYKGLFDGFMTMREMEILAARTIGKRKGGRHFSDGIKQQ